MTTKSKDTMDQEWRTIQAAEVKQEIVRRGIEALHVAGKIATLVSSDNAKSIKQAVSAKLLEFIKELKPIT